MNENDKENKENTGIGKKKEDEEDRELIATCLQCGFSGDPDEFDACLSVYHDLRCPECGTTDIEDTIKYRLDIWKILVILIL